MGGISKSTFREIKSSFGRFMAIFAITGLGVGFFAGLKITKEGMLATVQDYLDRHAFFDYRLLSTLGFEQEDVENLAAASDVEAAEGAISFDILYRREDGSQGAAKTYSITEKLNTVKLMAGRMPENGSECVADSNLFGESDIGSLIYLSEDNEEEDLEHFAGREYTVVGIARSPLYLQYERGNTSLGTGKVDCFLYLAPQGYDTDYFTEIYVRFSQDYDLYSQEYNDFIKEKNVIWEGLTASAAQRRYEDILREAEEELGDAEAELADKRAQGEQELADAALTLAEAEEKLAEGRQALSDAREELAEGERTLKEKAQEIRDAENTLAEKEQELAEGEELLAEKEQELAEAERILAEGEREFAEGERLLTEKEQELTAGEQLLAGKEQELAGAELQLQQREEELKAAEEWMLLPEEELAELRRGLEAARKELEQGRSALEESRRELTEGRSAWEAARRELTESQGALAEGRRELEEGRSALEDARREITEGRRELTDAGARLTEGKAALADGEKELQDGRETIEEKEEELLEAQQEYEEGLAEYREARQEFDEGIAQAEQEIEEARQQIEDIEEPDTYVLGRDTNIGYACFENDSHIVEGIANLFPAFFFLVAALVCITTMNRMVEEQRTQIGVLKALGYGNGAVMSKYMVYSGLAAVTGCVFGFFVGTWGFPKVIWMCYGIMYSADPVFYVFNGRLAVISLAVSLLCSMGTTWLSCRVELTQSAAVLMRPKAPKAGRRVFLERIPVLWKRLSFLQKVTVRNLFRYKKRLFMMVLGISGCTALLVTGFGIRDSIADIAEKQFREIQIYDISVSLKDSADEAFREKLEGMKNTGLKEYVCVMEKNMDLVTDSGVKAVWLVTGNARELPSYVQFRSPKGEQIAYPGPGEAVISNKLAEDYHLEIGDSIILRDENMLTLSVKVAAVYENYLYNYVHISEDTWRSLTGEEPERKTVYLNLAETLKEEGEREAGHRFSAELMKLAQVSNVTVNGDTMDRIGNMMASLNIIVAVVILCAAGLAFIVLYNLTNINITERVREIATVKVLGFYKKETSAYVFRENVLLSLLGMALGLVLGYFLHRVVMNEIRVDMITFAIYISPLSYLYSAILTLVFTWAVNWTMGGKLEEISMTESLKSVD